METATAVLVPERLCAEAERATGLADWGEPPFAEALERLCRSAVDDARLDERGVAAMSGRIGAILARRLQLYADRARYPEIAQQEIAPPLVVTGLPRSGTTILHALLAQDPAVRSPQAWELDSISPPPRAQTYRTDPRIAETQARIEQLPATFRAMHAMGATLPDECNSIMTMAFLSHNFGAAAKVTGYIDWLVDEADMAPAFALHRHVLQHLQAFAPGSRWVLKSPPYIFWLPQLAKAYPEAMLVTTHREPAEVIPSNASLMAFLLGETTPAGKRRVGEEQIAVWQRGLERMLACRAAGSAGLATCDVGYRAFMADQLAVVATIYDRFGLDLTAGARAAMAAFMEGNRQDKHGRHDYCAAEFGTDEAALNARFAGYRRAFLGAA